MTCPCPPGRTGTCPCPPGRTGTCPCPMGRTGTFPCPPGRTDWDLSVSTRQPLETFGTATFPVCRSSALTDMR